MENHIRIFNVEESDFDQMIIEAGGSRVVASKKVNALASDYILGSSAIELKLINEEGFEKKERQKKLASLFGETQKECPVILIKPEILSEKEKKAYSRIIETPIKSAISKANKQLEATSSEMESASKVLIIVNNGYQALSASEFQDIVVRRVQNDTKNIDHVIVAGVYFYGDGFDYYAFPRFSLVSINIRAKFNKYKDLEQEWNKYINKRMTQLIQDPDPDMYNRLPVVDIEFEHNNKTFVKPPPPIGKESEFYKNGRPRIENLEERAYPPVAKVIPSFDFSTWTLLNDHLDLTELTDSFINYGSWIKSLDEKDGKVLTPVVPFSISEVDFKIDDIISFKQLAELATEKFNEKLLKIFNEARAIEDSLIKPSSYVHLRITEIGQNSKNDLSDSYLVPHFGESEVLFQYQQIEKNFAIMLSSAYAIKHNYGFVRYEIDNENGWC